MISLYPCCPSEKSINASQRTKTKQKHTLVYTVSFTQKYVTYMRKVRSFTNKQGSVTHIKSLTHGLR